MYTHELKCAAIHFPFIKLQSVLCVHLCVYCVLLFSVDQVNNLHEIQALRRLNPHPNIIELKDVKL